MPRLWRASAGVPLPRAGAGLLPVKDKDFILIPRLVAQCSCVFIGERFSISRDGNTPSGADATLGDVFFHGAVRQIVIELAQGLVLKGVAVNPCPAHLTRITTF